MKTATHNYLDYKLCLSILRTLQTDKNLNESGGDNVFSIITFEENPEINYPGNLGFLLSDQSAVTLVKAEFKVSKDVFAVFRMSYDDVFVAAFRDGDPIENTEREMGVDFSDFKEGLGFFYKLCLCLKNPELRKHYANDKEMKVIVF